MKYDCETKVNCMLLVCCALVLAAPASAGPSNVHLTYHWHLHQPIYWPEEAPVLHRYQYAKDSIDLKVSNAGNYYTNSTYKHPRNNLVQGDGGEFDAVFDKDDRKQAYQHGGRNSIATITHHLDAGASVSYSGSLQENIGSLGRASSYGYGPDWKGGFTEARGWTTTDGFPRADMLGMTYHHSFSPLLPESVLRKEIQIFKEIWYKSWGGNPDKSDHSKGFWPIECAFSRHMIPVLLDEGYEWSIVANSHLARTCRNYMDVVQRGTSGWNIDPPNRADRLGPHVPAEQWYNGQIDGRGGAFPAPFAYQVHTAQWVDPANGNVRSLKIVPMCDLQSYINGFQTMGAGQIEGEIAEWATDGGHPCIVLLAHDGDNAWGGGASYYFESVRQLADDAAGRGMHPTTIQQFLHDHPTAPVAHIEDGAWVNAANDWGHPQFVNWLWPPARDPGDEDYDYDDPRTWIDIENGFAEDWRNWAVVLAGANFCETAEQYANDNAEPVDAWKIQEPYQENGTYNDPDNAEQAWHFFLGGLDSGFMYYGVSLDDEVKQTLACNRAIDLAQDAMADYPSSDNTPPTVFKPQRYPWNPGGMGWGPTTGYRPIGFDGAPPHYSDFYIWTLVFDVSGVTQVKLYVREDKDGTNALATTHNETYAEGADVKAWDPPVAMTKRVIDPNDDGGNHRIDFFMTPTHMADHYWARVQGYSEKLLDYYVEAVDTEGNVHKSDIQHVYVGQQNAAGSSVEFSEDPRDCAPLAVTYNAAGGPLDGISPVFQQISFDGASTWSNHLMAAAGIDLWVYTNMVPDNAPSATVNFHNGTGIADDNDGANWSTSIRDCEEPTGPSHVTFHPPAPSGCGDVEIVYHPNNGILRYSAQLYIHVGRNGWKDVIEPNPPMTAGPSNTWSFIYSPPAGTREINCVFNDGGTTWDNKEGNDWSVAVTGCDPVPIMAVPGSPAIGTDPAEQNNMDDAFDFDRTGSFAATTGQGGFGDFGRVHVNYDDTNLYVGALGCDISGNNNGMIIFLALNTLSDDAENLWGLSGEPAGLDLLHNVGLTPAMDIAIVLGDEWGDATDTAFALGDGYPFGQGIFYLSTSSSGFVEVAGARMLQFDHTGTNATGSTDYDGDRLMNRWEACLPWSSLNSSGIDAVTNFHIAGVVASSSVTNNDRYLSGNYLGDAASGTLESGNYGFNFLTLTGTRVHGADLDSDGDDLPDRWELRFGVNLGLLAGGEDADSDGASDDAEYGAGTDPTDAASLLQLLSIDTGTGASNVVLRWQSVLGKQYGISWSSNLAEGFAPLETGIPSMPAENVHTTAVPEVGAGFFQVVPE